MLKPAGPQSASASVQSAKHPGFYWRIDQIRGYLSTETGVLYQRSGSDRRDRPTIVTASSSAEHDAEGHDRRLP
jgi:hypothetical protein